MSLWFESVLAPLLARRGYVLDEKRTASAKGTYCYERTSQGISNRQEIFLQEYGESLVTFTIILYSHQVNDLLEAFELSMPSHRLAMADLNQIMPLTDDWHHGLPPQQKTEELIRQLEMALDILDQSTTLEGLDYIMNAPDSFMSRRMHASCFIPHCAVVAWLAGNPDFENLVVKLEAAKLRAGVSAAAMYKGEFLRMVSYLREQVKPSSCSSGPRLQHLQIAHLLVRLMLQEPDETFSLYSSEESNVFLSRLWEHVGSSLPAEQRRNGKGLSVWHRPTGEDTEAVVLSLPIPQGRGESWFVAAFRTPDGGTRVFALEKGLEPGTDQPLAILAEIRPDGRANWGPVGEPRLEYFVQDIDAIIHDPDAAPMAFTAMQIIESEE